MLHRRSIETPPRPLLAVLLLLAACSKGQTGDAGLENDAIDQSNGQHDPDRDAGGSTQPSDTPSSVEPPAPSDGEPNDPSDPITPIDPGCAVEGDGSRSGDHSPDASDSYLPDCDLDLQREYYRVFVKADGTAYMMPRPDGHPALAEPCVSELHPLREVLLRYGLCQSAESSAEVDVINSMAPDDALAVASFLHSQLVFHGSESGVVPYPFNSDVLAACEADEALRSGVLEARCEFEFAARDSGSRDDIGFSHTGEEGLALAAALNDLYGIEGELLCGRLSDSVSRSIRSAVVSANECSTDGDCVPFDTGTSCVFGCNELVGAEHLDAANATRQELSDGQCALYEGADCPAFGPGGCAPPRGAPRCIDSVCVYAEAESAPDAGAR